MTSERWERVARVMESALEREPAARAAFLRDACAGDDALREEVSALLAHDSGTHIIDQPILAVAATLLEAEARLESGTTLGPYRVDRLLGVGGMGQVYQATDTRLNRTVAVKILPPDLATDRQFRARFDREARTIASLTHPHICTLYDVGHDRVEGHDVEFLVLELLEGETLQARLARGPLPFEQALAHAIQIASALARAHGEGVIHRDLKPANIFLVKGGGASARPTAKLLDFGLAKPAAPIVAAYNRSQRVTPPPHTLTEQGTIVGTFQYMAPEELDGRDADARTDLFAFGAVAYEMFTGRKAFEGESQASLIGAILHTQPALVSATQPLTPPLLDRLVRECLAKDPDERRQSAHDLEAELRWLADASPINGPATTAAAAVPAKPRWRLAAAAAVAGLVVALAGAAVGRVTRATPAPPVAKFQLSLPAGQVFGAALGRHMLTLSRDGTQIAVVTVPYGLQLRRLAELETHNLTGTHEYGRINEPVFSPDGGSLAFFADGAIRRVSVAGGSAATIAAADLPMGMTWTGETIFVGQGSKGIVRLPAAGGAPEQIVEVKADELAHGPQLLPGGDHLLFTIASGHAPNRWDNARIVVQSLTSQERRVIVEGGKDGRYIPSGHILYVHANVLYAMPFDVRRMAAVGAGVPVAQRVASPPESGTAHFSVAETGTMAYVEGVVDEVPTQLGLIDRAGTISRLTDALGVFRNPRVSPDGTRITFSVVTGVSEQIWVFEIDGRSPPRRLTFEGNNRYPIWSSDGIWIAFQSDRSGDQGIFRQRADGTGTAERITTAPPGVAHVPDSWSPTVDGFLYSVLSGTESTLVMFSMADRRAVPFGDVRSTIPINATFSPDGRWVAYATFEQRPTTYVQPFPATGVKYQLVPRTGENAFHPVWSRDGKSLFFNPRPEGFDFVSVTTTPSFAFGAPVAVYAGRRPFSLSPPEYRREYDVTRDGRFVARVPAEGIQFRIGGRNDYTLVLNWVEELKALVKVER